MKKNIFYSLMAAAFLLSSCGKEDLSLDLSNFNWGGGPYNIKFNGSSFDSTALTYIQIPLNRYFIYKDLTTGNTDSVVVTESTDSSGFQQASPGYPIGYFYTKHKLTINKISGSFSETWYSGSATSDFPANNGSTPTWIYDSNFMLSNDMNNIPAFWYPFTTSGRNDYTYNNTMTIEGRIYSGVHSFSTNNGFQPGDVNYVASLFCWVKGIGIIKREIRTSNSVKTSVLLRFG